MVLCDAYDGSHNYLGYLLIRIQPLRVSQKNSKLGRFSTEKLLSRIINFETNPSLSSKLNLMLIFILVCFLFSITYECCLHLIFYLTSCLELIFWNKEMLKKNREQKKNREWNEKARRIYCKNITNPEEGWMANASEFVKTMLCQHCFLKNQKKPIEWIDNKTTQSSRRSTKYTHTVKCCQTTKS